MCEMYEWPKELTGSAPEMPRPSAGATTAATIDHSSVSSTHMHTRKTGALAEDMSFERTSNRKAGKTVAAASAVGWCQHGSCGSDGVMWIIWVGLS